MKAMYKKEFAARIARDGIDDRFIAELQDEGALGELANRGNGHGAH